MKYQFLVKKISKQLLWYFLLIYKLLKRVAHYKSYQRENGGFAGDIVSGNVSPQKRMIDIKLIKS